MAKISKSDLKIQRELLAQINSEEKLTEDQVWNIYENFDPAMLSNLTERGVFFTPIMLAQDCAVFSPRYGHIIDVCAGIGGLAYRLQQMDSYDRNIKSITCIELNPEFVKIGKRLLPNVTWICGNAFDKELWDKLTENGTKKFDLMVSNPPFGKLPKDFDCSWMNYTGELDLMCLELCLKFANEGYFILPAGSVEFRYSGRQWGYERIEQRKVTSFRKKNPDTNFVMVCDGIDTAFHRENWKNASPAVEAVNIICNKDELKDYL